MSENQAHRQEDKKDVLGSLSWSSFAVSLWFGGTSKRQGHESSKLEDKTSLYSQISWTVNRYRMLYCNDSAICLWNLGGIVFDVWMYSNLHMSSWNHYQISLKWTLHIYYCWQHVMNLIECRHWSHGRYIHFLKHSLWLRGWNWMMSKTKPIKTLQ